MPLSGIPPVSQSPRFGAFFKIVGNDQGAVCDEMGTRTQDDLWALSTVTSKRSGQPVALAATGDDAKFVVRERLGFKLGDFKPKKAKPDDTLETSQTLQAQVIRALTAQYSRFTDARSKAILKLRHELTERAHELNGQTTEVDLTGGDPYVHKAVTPIVIDDGTVDGYEGDRDANTL